jgi:hypothetical protein
MYQDVKRNVRVNSVYRHTPVAVVISETQEDGGTAISSSVITGTVKGSELFGTI